MEHKFLDQKGVQYLWSKVSLEDYPNNETLIAVLNAIDQTKADKEEVDKQIAVMNDRVVATDDGELTNVLPDMFGGHTPDEYMLKAEMPEVEKSDWSVNDENDAAYIKNRTHWTDDDGTVHKIDEKYLPDVGVRSWNDLTDKPFGGTTTTTILNNYSLSNPVSDMSTLRADRNMYNVNVGNIGFNVGDTVTVIWNDEKYVLKAYDSGGVAAVGNDAYVSGGEDTGEPFAIGYMSPSLIIVTFDSDVVVSIDIGETKKMSGKYVEGMGWSEKTKKVVLPETVLSESVQQGHVYLYMLDCSFEVGKKYTVVYNGVEYDVATTVINENDGVVGGGNLSLVEFGEDTGEPFVIACNPKMALVGALDGSGITIAIYGEDETVHPIDMKYFPELNYIKTVNGSVPDENGNVEIEVDKVVKTVNGSVPDENGNVEIEVDKVVKGNYTLQSGVSQYSEYGFGIYYDNEQKAYYGPGSMQLYNLYWSGQQLKLGDDDKDYVNINPSVGSSNDASLAISHRNESTHAADEFIIYSDGKIVISDRVMKLGWIHSPTIIRYVKTPEQALDAVNKEYVDAKVSDKELILTSSTEGSTKRFKITVNDAGVITATEIAE